MLSIGEFGPSSSLHLEIHILPTSPIAAYPDGFGSHRFLPSLVYSLDVDAFSNLHLDRHIRPKDPTVAFCISTGNLELLIHYDVGQPGGSLGQ